MMSAHIVGEMTELAGTAQAGAKRRGGGRSRGVHLHGTAEAEPAASVELKMEAEPQRDEGEQLPQTPKSTTAAAEICLRGAVDIVAAAALKQQLQEALGSGNEIRVSLKEVSELDVTAVQLLYAARRAARAAGVDFRMAAPPPEICRALAEVGLESFVVAES
jgi:anti-anti-sigma factor